MAKPLDPKKVKLIVADWKTGAFTQRKLAEKYKLSNGAVAKITKGITHDNEQIVSKGVEYYRGLEVLREQSHEQDIKAVITVVEEKVLQLNWFNNAAMKVAEMALNSVSEKSPPSDLKTVTDVFVGSMKAAQLVPYYPNSTTITNTNAQQTVSEKILTLDDMYSGNP